MGRIAQVTGNQAATFAFDAAGSLTTLGDGQTLTYDTARQLSTSTTPATDTTAAVTSSFTYDARGNRATTTTDTPDAAGTITHTYNQANQLTTLTGVDGTATTYTYDASGLRASATTTTGTTVTSEQYTWDTLAGIPELLTDATHAYLYGTTAAPLAQYDLTDGTVDYLHSDLLGSIRTTTDTTGTVTSDADYDTYGQPLAVTADPASAITRFGYAGEYTDPTGYLYLRARYYDPVTAQFLTRDPLEATTNNPYGYTDGNPLQFVDPTGLINWGTVIGVGVITAIAIGAVLCVASVACAAAVGVGGAGFALAGGGTLAAASALSISEVVAGAALAGVGSAGLSAAMQGDFTGPKKSGTPRSNTDQNKQFNDAVKAAEQRLGRKISKDERTMLHRAISGQDFGYHEIVKEAVCMFGGAV